MPNRDCENTVLSTVRNRNANETIQLQLSYFASSSVNEMVPTIFHDIRQSLILFNSASLMISKIARSLLLLSVGLPVANAPDVLQPCGSCTTLDVQTLTTSRLTKRTWQSEVELNLIIFRRSNFHH